MFEVTNRMSYFHATMEKNGGCRSWMKEITDRLDENRSTVIILGEFLALPLNQGTESSKLLRGGGTCHNLGGAKIKWATLDCE